MTVKVHIAVLMMVKNEKKRIKVTLESIRDFADSLIIYDTGSIDNTIDIIQDFSEKYNIPLRLKQGEFVDFCTSRNVSLNFADTFEDVDFLLLMDVNDELRGKEKLRKFCEEKKDDKTKTGFLMCQEWWSGQYDRYYNIRLIKARKNWRYRGSVHEWIKDESRKDDEPEKIEKMMDNVILFQDRTQDDDKTGKRFERDKVLLMKDYQNNPNDTRITFYLAQTCACLKQYEDAYYYYKLRSNQEGFQEEKFHAFLKCGDIAEKLNHPWHNIMMWYMKAFEHSNRAEPLVKIAKYYINIKQYRLAFTFINLCCELDYPEECILFVDKKVYDYTRWHLMGIIAYYYEKYEEGYTGCINALKAIPDSEIDKINIKFYIEKLK